MLGGMVSEEALAEREWVTRSGRAGSEEGGHILIRS